MLFVENDGLKFADPNGLQLPADAPAVLPPQPKAAPLQSLQSSDQLPAATPSPRMVQIIQPKKTTPSGPGAFSGWGARIWSDLFSWLFGLGAVLVVTFLFLPIIDQMHLLRRSAYIQARDAREALADRKLDETDKSGKPNVPESAERRRRRETREDWLKQKTDLDAEIEEMRFDGRQNNYLYAWGMLVGFLLLAIAAIGFVNPRQTTVRRVLGCIIISAELLLIFTTYVIRSASLTGGP